MKSFSTNIMQASLLDFTPKEIVDEAVQRSEDHANREWVILARTCLKSICERKDTFTVDDLCHLLSRYEFIQTHNTSALGAIMRHGARMRWMRQTGEWELSRDPKKHSRALRIWKSLLYIPSL